MKLLRITAKGLPLFKKELEIDFYANQRVAEDDKDTLINEFSNIYVNPANGFIGINAAGKTSVLKVVLLALGILNNEPLNHIESKSILGSADNVEIGIYFHDGKENVNYLSTIVSSKKISGKGVFYFIKNEQLWQKSVESIKSKKNLFNFEGIDPIAVRNKKEMFLSDDVSFIIAENKKNGNHLSVYNLMSYTNVNVLPISDEIPLEVVRFLDPTVEELYFETVKENTSIHLKFYEEEEIILNNSEELEQYLSSGTIKGIITFTMVIETLKTGGYLLIDEIENHFNKEIVTTLLRLFLDRRFNKNGGILVFTTHYPELLDEYDRNDSIHIVRNRNGITVEKLSDILKRNDIKKSDAYQSGLLEGTTPAYEAYLSLKKKIASSI